MWVCVCVWEGEPPWNHNVRPKFELMAEYNKTNLVFLGV